MAFYVVRHKVKDFDAWKKAYDGFEPTRKQYGVQEHYATGCSANPGHPPRTYIAIINRIIAID